MSSEHAPAGGGVERRTPRRRTRQSAVDTPLGEEAPLLRIAGRPDSPTRAVAARTSAPAEKADVLRTPSGDSADEIIAAWVGWATHATEGVPPPRNVIARLGKEVKTLIASSYDSSHIKMGLAVWTLAFMENAMTSPTQLPALTWQWAMNTSAKANAWRQEQRRLLHELGIRTGKSSARDERRQRTSDAIASYSARRAHYDVSRGGRA